MDYYEAIEMIIGFIGVIGILIPSVGFPLAFSYKKRKLEEEHRTNNLAIAYQILSSRQEVSMEQVQQLMLMSAGDEQQMLESIKRITQNR